MNNDIAVTLSADDRALLAVLKDAGADIQHFAAKGGSALRDLEAAARTNTTGFERMADGMKTAFIGGGVAAAIITIKNAIGSVTLAMIDAQMQADKVKNSLSFAMGGPQAAKEIEYLREVTDALGVSFATVAPMYGRLAAATKGTNLEGRATREIFESIAQASVVMGLGVEETEGAMRALVQMVSKGQIQAEELRGQLGERLPRAFQIFAESMGVTTAELSKLLEAGKVGPEVLANFAATLKGELAGSLDEATVRLAANVNRLDNAWLRLKQNVGEAGVSSFMSGQMAVLADAANDVGISMERARAGGDGFAGQMVSATGAVLRFLNPFNAISYSVQDQVTQLKVAQSQLKDYEAALAKDPTNTFLIRGIQQIKETVAWLKAANAEKDKFAAVGQSHRQREDASMGKWSEQQAQQARELADIRGRLAGVDKDYLPTLMKLNDAYKSGAIGQAEYAALVGDLAKKNYTAAKSTSDHGAAARKAAEEIKKLAEAERKHNEDLGKTITTNQLAVNKWLEGNEKTLESLITANEALRLQNEAIGLNQAATDALTLSRQAAAIAQAELTLIEAQNIEGNAARVAQIEREIRLLKERKELTAAGQTLRAQAEAQKTAAEATEKAAKDAAAEWASMWKSVDDTAHDVFVDVARDGVDAFDRIGKTLQSAVLDLLYQMTAKQWLISISGGALSDGGGAAGGGSSLFGSASNAASLYSAGSSAYTVGSQVLGGTMGMGNAAGTLFANASTVGAGTALDGLLATNAAYGTAAAGSTGALASLAAAAPYIAAFVAAVYLMEQYGPGSGTAHMGGGSQFSAAGGLMTTGTMVPESVSEGYWAPSGDGDPVWVADRRVTAAHLTGSENGGGFAGGFSSVGYSQTAVDLTTGIAQGIVGLLDATATTFGKVAGYTAATSFADDSSKDGAWGSLVISDAVGTVLANWQASESFRVFSDGAAGSAEYQAAIAADVRGVLVAIDLPAWADDMLAAIGDTPDLTTLSAGVAQINLAKAALVTMGQKLTGFAALSDGAISALIKASGGFETLATHASTYYDAFYTEGEKTAFTLSEIGAQLQAVGVALPTTRDGFREYVEYLQSIADTEPAAASALAAMLKVSGAFASVVPAATEAAAILGEVGKTLEQIANERSGLKTALLQALGDTAALRQQEMDALDPTNRALQQSLYNLADVREAITLLDTQASDTASTIASLQESIAGWASTMQQAGALLNSISMARGGADNTEAGLWASTGTGSLSDQLGTAQSLLAIVNASIAQDTETLRRQVLDVNTLQQQGANEQLQNAQKMVDLARDLRDYVGSLKIGSLSALTPAQKLAEAAGQYQGLLAGATAGDTTALAGLKGGASSYLELARAFDPEAYTSIFSNVTGTLDSLGGTLLTEGQQALATSTEQLDQLKTIALLIGAQSAADTTASYISAANAAKLDELTTIAAGIQAQAAIGKAADMAALTAAQARSEAIALEQIAAQTLLLGVQTDARNVLAALPGVLNANNAALVDEIRALNERIQAMEATMVQVGIAQVQTAVNAAGQVVEAVSTGAANGAYNATLPQPVV